jgi:hypothetical protein
MTIPYAPAFFEIWVGWTVVMAWARWLDLRSPEEGLRGRLPQVLPWVVGLVVLAGQLAAMWAVVQMGVTDTPPAVFTLLSTARWASMAAVVVALAIELGLTVLALRQRPGAA